MPSVSCQITEPLRVQATMSDYSSSKLSSPYHPSESEIYAGYVREAEAEADLVSEVFEDAPEQEYEQLPQSLVPRDARIDSTTWTPYPSHRDQTVMRASNPGISWQNVISASQVDPFSTQPIQVDQVTNELLQFYMMQRYWQTAYALSAKIMPSIKGSWLKIAQMCVSHFHILMARSAMHQLRMNSYAPPKAQKSLELAALKHHSEAVTNLRELISAGRKADLRTILTSIVSLATFEMRYGNYEKALVHFKAARDVFRQVDKQDGTSNLSAEQQALWFEGVYEDPGASFMWGPEDINTRLSWLNEILEDVNRIWWYRQLLPLKSRKSIVAQHTRFYEFLARDTEGKMISAYADISESASQQRCMLIFLSIITELYRQGDSGPHSMASAEPKAIADAVQSYSAWVEEMLIEHNLDEKDTAADLLWLMLQDFRKVKPQSANSAALDALYRLDLRDRQWRACGIANVVKYLPRSSQLRLKDQLLAFVEGRRYDGKLELNAFAFSYAYT